MKRLVLLIVMAAGIAVFLTAQTNVSGFRQEGIASWYGSEFDGKPTASGEIFNSGLYTAAHPSLPFGTVVTVTNKQNNIRVNVRINDRGPFVAARIIDLSRAAAEVLDMLITGTAPVLVEQADNNAALGPAGEAPPVVVVPETPPIIAEPAPPPPPVIEPPVIEPKVAEVPVVPEEKVVVPEVPAPVIAQAPAPEPPVIVPQPQPAIIPQPQPVIPPQPVAPPQPVIPVIPPVYAPPPVTYSAPPARIIGGIPPAGSTRSYRLQVGAYRVPRNAVEAFDRLKNAGLKPAYEQFNDLYRVVLPGLRATEIQAVAQILGNAGFPEALIREER